MAASSNTRSTGLRGELPALPALRAAAGPALVEVTAQEVADGWEERWRQFHQPLVLGSRLTVRPPWEPPRDTELDVVIDPGRRSAPGRTRRPGSASS